MAKTHMQYRSSCDILPEYMRERLAAGVLASLLLAIPWGTYADCNLVIMRTLSYGADGPDVRNLQIFLFDYGGVFKSPATGYYGRQTEAAVQKWQAMHGVISYGTPATTGYGVVGKKTRAAITAHCASESKGTYPEASI
jgi:hypothetical protein